MKKSTAFRWVLSCFLFAAPVLQAEDALTEKPPVTQPATQPAPDALKALADLAAKPRLLLTNDGSSAHEKFSFALAIHPPPGGQGQSTTVLVVRDGDRMGVVVGARGLPCYYMTDGLLIAVDPRNPGKLMMHEGGSVRLLFGGKEAGAKSGLGYIARGRQNSIVLDPAAMLTSIALTVNQTDYRPDLQRLGLKTESGHRVKIKLPRDDKVGAYPIESLLFQAHEPDGLTFAFANVTPNVVLKKSIAYRTAEDCRKLKIPIRMLTDADLEKDYFALARKDFGENDEEQETAEKLRGLFPDDMPDGTK